MNGELPSLTKRLGAPVDVAYKGFGSSVGVFMLFKVLLEDEPLVTEFTYERFLLLVDQIVSLKRKFA